MTDSESTPFRAVIADDERLMRDQLRARLTEVWPQLQIVGEAKNGQEAVEQVREHQPDLVFLDIRMPGMTGIEAAREIAQLPDDEHALPEIVFITAYDEYAVQAFEQGVADYVLKPAERDRLLVTTARVRERLRARQQMQQALDSGGHSTTADGGESAGVNSTALQTRPLQQLLHQLAHGGAKPSYLQWIQASVGSSIQMIPVDEVLFFISDEKYTRVQTASLEALIRKPIKELVDELDPQRFWQIHRSTLVNAHAIAGVARDMRGRQIVSIKGRNDKLEVSRSYLGLFKGM